MDRVKHSSKGLNHASRREMEQEISIENFECTAEAFAGNSVVEEKSETLVVVFAETLEERMHLTVSSVERRTYSSSNWLCGYYVHKYHRAFVDLFLFLWENF